MENIFDGRSGGWTELSDLGGHTSGSENEKAIRYSQASSGTWMILQKCVTLKNTLSTNNFELKKLRMVLKIYSMFSMFL